MAASSAAERLTPLRSGFDPERHVRDLPVPGAGRYDDDRWVFRVDAGGIGTVVIDWRLDDPEGTKLEPDQWPALLAAAKWFTYTLLTDNARGRSPRPGGLRTLHAHLVYFVRWMARSNYASFSEFDDLAAREFVQHLATHKVDLEDARTADTLTQYVDIPRRIFEQRDALDPWPGTAMTRHPFEGRAAWAVACDIARKAEGWIPPVPDDFWRATVKAASAWVEGPARDVVRLGRILVATRSARDEGTESFDAIRQDDPDGTLLAWVTREVGRDPRRPGSPGNLALRRTYFALLRDTRDACTILIQAMLGLRISEVAGLKATPVDPRTGWPACLEIRPSRTGLNDLFFVVGQVFKGRGGVPADWVAGSRPHGSDYLPVVVGAFRTLEEAYRPWRTLGGSADLIVDLGRAPERPWLAASVAHPDSAGLARGQKRFVNRRVDLPETVREWTLSSHQWRKSFAIFMVRSDERMLAAVSDHFKHLSVAMTEQGYVGSDIGLLGLIEDEAVRTAARTMFEAIHGKGAVSGTTADILMHGARDILAEASDEERTDDETIERLGEAVRTDDVRVYQSAWGRCMFRPETAMCHHRVGNKFDLSARAPLQGHRHAGICCSCANLLVFDGHAEFWSKRLDENRAVLDACKDAPDGRAAAVAVERIKMAERVLARHEAARKNQGRTRTHADR